MIMSSYMVRYGKQQKKASRRSVGRGVKGSERKKQRKGSNADAVAIIA